MLEKLNWKDYGEWNSKKRQSSLAKGFKRKATIVLEDEFTLTALLLRMPQIAGLPLRFIVYFVLFYRFNS